jgi:hypothetical protein
MFKAVDGAMFASAMKCQQYEAMLTDIKRIMKPLGRLPKDPHCNFANGEGYLQHNPIDVRGIKNQLVAFGRKYLHINEAIGFDMAGRYFDDSGVNPGRKQTLYRAWYRLACCDVYGREWGQMFFAINPDKGKNIPYKETKIKKPQAPPNVNLSISYH